MNNETRPTSKTPYVAAGILGVAVIGGVVAWAFGAGGTNTEDQTPVATGTPQAAPETSMYKDGAYTQTGTYLSPAGQEAVEVTLTLEGDVVTNAAFTGKATNATSKLVQGKFAEGYTQMVVGKKLDEIALGVVNGSSLTPKGFMDAVAKIQVQAQS